MDAVACRDCDLLHAAVVLGRGEHARCVRCGAPLAMPGPVSHDSAAALVVTALIAFAIGNATPLMAMSELGQASSTTVAQSAVALWRTDSQPAAVLVALCSVLLPAAYMAFALAALVAVRGGEAPHWAGRVARWSRSLEPWSMPEIMLLGTLVAYVKVSELARAAPGPGMYATGAAVVLIAGLQLSRIGPSVWQRVPWQR
jgi:paraquat-inducible protein A